MEDTITITIDGIKVSLSPEDDYDYDYILNLAKQASSNNNITIRKALRLFSNSQKLEDKERNSALSLIEKIKDAKKASEKAEKMAKKSKKRSLDSGLLNNVWAKYDVYKFFGLEKKSFKKLSTKIPNLETQENKNLEI